MKHLIFGAGVIGKATGTLLEAHGETVIYYDIDNKTIVDLQDKGKYATEVLPSDWDYCWMCVHESLLPKAIPQRPRKDSIIIIRSTVEPILFDYLDPEYVVHFPEFLREKTSTEDIFYPSHIVIGIEEKNIMYDEIVAMATMFSNGSPISIVPRKISSMIKLITNAYLATQISFWNEMYELLEPYKNHRQLIANIVSNDERVSKYGTIMSGKPYGGKCLPKDVDHLISMMHNSILLNSVKNVNNKR